MVTPHLIQLPLKQDLSESQAESCFRLGAVNPSHYLKPLEAIWNHAPAPTADPSLTVEKLLLPRQGQVIGRPRRSALLKTLIQHWPSESQKGLSFIVFPQQEVIR